MAAGRSSLPQLRGIKTRLVVWAGPAPSTFNSPILVGKGFSLGDGCQEGWWPGVGNTMPRSTRRGPVGRGRAVCGSLLQNSGR